MSNQTFLDLNKSIDYVNYLDFSPIVNKLIKQMGWRKRHALETCELYRKYLILQRKYNHLYNLPPSEDIDDFWHMHILDTKTYRKDCEVIFGYYLDHYPYLGIDASSNLNDLERAFAKTQELFASEFGGQEIFQVRGFWTKVWAFLKVSLAKKPKRIALTVS